MEVTLNEREPSYPWLPNPPPHNPITSWVQVLKNSSMDFTYAPSRSPISNFRGIWHQLVAPSNHAFVGWSTFPWNKYLNDATNGCLYHCEIWLGKLNGDTWNSTIDFETPIPVWIYRLANWELRLGHQKVGYQHLKSNHSLCIIII